MTWKRYRKYSEIRIWDLLDRNPRQPPPHSFARDVHDYSHFVWDVLEHSKRQGGSTPTYPTHAEQAVALARRQSTALQKSESRQKETSGASGARPSIVVGSDPAKIPEAPSWLEARLRSSRLRFLQTQPAYGGRPAPRSRQGAGSPGPAPSSRLGSAQSPGRHP